MKILYLLQDFPYPPDDGVRIKTFDLITYMGRKHECHILSFYWGDKGERVEEFRRIVPNVKILGLFSTCSGIDLHAKRFKHLLRGRPVFLSRWDSGTFAHAVQRALIANDYDVVHIDGLALAPYLRFCKTKPTVLSTTDSVSRAYKGSMTSSALFRMYLSFAVWSIMRFERKVLPSASKVHVVSEPDAQYLLDNVPGIRIESIELAVSSQILQYPFWRVRAGESKRILFSGNVSAAGIAKGLLDFLWESYPIIQRTFSDVEMVVLGRNAAASFQRQIKCVPNVHFISWVKDYSGEVAAAQVVIIPDRSGTGIKSRVLHAMALARPVVGTALALEGIPVQDGVHCFVRDTPSSFAQAVIDLLRDEELRKHMGEAARRLITEMYTVDTIGSRWESLYERAIAEGKGD